MKHLKLTIIIFGLLIFGYNQSYTKTTTVKEAIESNTTNDTVQIQNLIRQVLNWADSKNSIDLLPILSDSKDSIYIGFDLEKHKQNLNKLLQTNFFTNEFIETYNQIILTLDKGLKNGKYEQWLTGSLPTFPFANDLNPWCECQDVPYDKPNPWDFIEIEIINLDSKNGNIIWRWGKTELNGNPDWKVISHNFKVVKENDNWKISYMHGFDFKESTKID